MFRRNGNRIITAEFKDMSLTILSESLILKVRIPVLALGENHTCKF